MTGEYLVGKLNLCALLLVAAFVVAIFVVAKLRGPKGLPRWMRWGALFLAVYLLAMAPAFLSMRLFVGVNERKGIYSGLYWAVNGPIVKAVLCSSYGDGVKRMDLALLHREPLVVFGSAFYLAIGGALGAVLEIVFSGHRPQVPRGQA